MKNDLLKQTISINKTIKEVLHLLNATAGTKTLTLFVLNKKKQLVGTITDGDIRRGFLNGLTVNSSVADVMQRNFRYLNANFTLDDVLEIKRKGIKLVPLLNKDRKINKIYDLMNTFSILPIEAVIMAGGRGERLRPLTDTTPKPLLRLGKKPIIEHNLDRLAQYGVNRFFITVKYLGQQIIDYFKDGCQKGIEISYIKEDKPLGTIGAARLINSFKNDHILITNSDLFTNINYEDLYRNFLEANADMAVASVPYHIDVPYAVLETHKGRITSFREKPSYTYHSNAGIYLIKKELLKLIPVKDHFNATDMIQMLIDSGYKVIHSPILGYWIDIGKFEDYNKAIQLMDYLK